MRVSHISSSIVAALALLVCTMVSASAQSQGAAKANEQAYSLYANGDYEQAAQAYEQLIKDYATDSLVPVARVQLAFCYYFLGQQEKVLAEIDRLLKGPPLPPELKQIADGLLPQALSAQSGALPLEDAKRKAGFEDAVKKFNEYLTAYPNAQDAEAMVYARAIANYQLGNFDEVLKDMESNLSRFGNSPSILDSQNLLALALATQGSMELTKGEEGDKNKAFSSYKRSTDLLRDIIRKKTDLTLVNDAYFQLAEILFNQASFSAPEERPALYAEALEAYRSIAPKEEMVQLQEQKLAAFPDRLRSAIRTGNVPLRQQVEALRKREAQKLAELQAKPDQVGTAMQKMGEIYFSDGDYNKSRTVISHVRPFLQSEEDKKRALYFTAMTYLMQNQASSSVDAYNSFQAEYKGDPMAQNLPLAMGNLFLNHPDPETNDVNKSVGYFKESLEIYPDGQFVSHSVVSQAAAQQRLGQNEAALKTFQDFLSKNPSPDVGVIAQNGVATIYKDTAQWDQAIAAYQELRQKYADTPQAVDAEFWIAVCTQQKGDNAGAIPQLEKFIAEQPENPLAPTALYALGGAQLAVQNQEAGLKALADLAEKYPDSPPAPFTYFMRAQVLGPAGKTEEVLELMKQFIERYPQDDKVFFAYDALAQNATNTGNPEEAIRLYKEFSEKYSANPQAAEALLKVANLQLGRAEALGRYGALNEEERAKWQPNVESSIATTREIFVTYPDSPSLASALRTLLSAQRLLVVAEQKSPEDVVSYFEELAESAPNATAKSKALFTLASYLSEADPGRGLALMEEAFDPAITFAPADLDTFGLALVNNDKLDLAQTVFEKLANDYPNPPGAAPNAAPLEIQQAQAIALFGKGRVAQAKGETATAGQFFEQLKELYPWSPKVMEANYGIADSLKGQRKYDEALGLLTGIIRAPTAETELRANAMLLLGDIMADKRDAATNEEERNRMEDAAIDNYIKIATFYQGVPKAAANGLWKGGQLLEKQSARFSDDNKRKAQLAKAIDAYQQLLKEFPNSEYAPQAKERLTALGATAQ